MENNDSGKGSCALGPMELTGNGRGRLLGNRLAALTLKAKLQRCRRCRGALEANRLGKSGRRRDRKCSQDSQKRRAERAV